MADSILVTGGAGYIGSHVCKALAQNGFVPIAFDNLSTGHGYAVKWGPFVEGDLNDSEALAKAFSLYQPKAVMHFAANALVVESMLDPGKYYRNNIGSTVSLLDAMRKAGVNLFVFSSTCAIFGQPRAPLIDEKHPQLPINAYGRTKWMVEQMLDDFELAYGLKSIKLRYFNAAGADLETLIGENHTPETHLIPSIIQTAMEVRNEVCVYGTNFPTVDGSAVRDYIHVQDLADAHVLALNYLLNGQESIALNLGTGIGYSVLEIIRALEKYCGQPLPVRFEKQRMGEPSHLIATAEKAKEILGWSPKVSDLDTILDSAWKWHKLLIENTPLLRKSLESLESAKS